MDKNILRIPAEEGYTALEARWFVPKGFGAGLFWVPMTAYSTSRDIAFPQCAAKEPAYLW